MPFIKDTKGEMARVLGRDPSDAETYAGHHFGSVRAARMMKMDPNTPVDQVFSPTEMALNPHFAKAGTVGNLNASVTSDITRRQARFGGAEAPDLAEFGTPLDGGSTKTATGPDLSSFGKLANIEQPPTGGDPEQSTPEPAPTAPPPQSSAPDLSSLGTAA